MYRPGIRPNRPPAPPTDPPPRPSLNEYEMQFDNEFLDPPQPGGFGQPRHWPVSYLHKEMPPNVDAKMGSMTMNGSDPKLSAIENLINVIKSNDLRNIEFHITNRSNKNDDVLFVRIPLPMSNVTNETTSTTTVKPEKMVKLEESKNSSSATEGKNATNLVSLEPIDVVDEKPAINIRSQKSLPVNNTFQVTLSTLVNSYSTPRTTPIYRKGTVERTNVTTHGRRARNYRIRQ